VAPSNQALVRWVDGYGYRLNPRPITFECVLGPGIYPDAIQGFCDVGIRLNVDIIDTAKKVSLLNSSPIAGTFLDHDLRLDAFIRLSPDTAIIGSDVTALLVDIEAADGKQPQCQQGGSHESERKKLLAHDAFGNRDTDYRTEV